MNCLIVGHSPGFNCIGSRGASKNIGLGRILRILYIKYFLRLFLGASLRGRTATQRSKTRVLRRFWTRVLGKGFQKGCEKGAFFYGFYSKKGSEKGSRKGF